MKISTNNTNEVNYPPSVILDIHPALDCDSTIKMQHNIED